MLEYQGYFSLLINASAIRQELVKTIGKLAEDGRVRPHNHPWLCNLFGSFGAPSSHAVFPDWRLS